MEFKKNPKDILIFGLAVCGFILLFLTIYRPFFLQELNPKLLLRLALAICSFTGLLSVVTYGLASTRFQSYTDQWTLFKECLWILGHFLVIGSFNYFLINRLEGIGDFSWFKVFYFTVLVGIIPVGLDLIFRLKKRTWSRTESETSHHQHALVYVKSEGNYIELYQLNREKGDLKREVRRESLKNFMANGSRDFIQVHRSFAVNPEHIQSISGNSNGGTIRLSNGLEVPFSRGYYENVTPLKNQLILSS